MWRRALDILRGSAIAMAIDGTGDGTAGDGWATDGRTAWWCGSAGSAWGGERRAATSSLCLKSFPIRARRNKRNALNSSGSALGNILCSISFGKHEIRSIQIHLDRMYLRHETWNDCYGTVWVMAIADKKGTAPLCD